MIIQLLLVIVIAAIASLFLYWLLVITEGVYLGRRLVVWMYDLTAHKYDRIKEFDDESEQFFVARPLAFHLRHAPSPRVLDVGTGTGRLPYYLLDEATFNGRVIGLDPSANMLALAKRKLSPYGHRATLVQQTAVPLPFSDHSFDAVSCLESLEFFPSDVDALEEMVRVLRPGGVLLITRRRGWEAKAFLGRYRDRQQFEEMLSDMGLVEVNTQPWQIDYDQIFAQKSQPSQASDSRI
jgi:ubiquinone/menaquinone biosynthesis C-methylase UbiE